MAAESAAEREARLAKALKKNIKRRKASASRVIAVAARDVPAVQQQNSLNSQPEAGPKTASKRN